MLGSGSGLVLGLKLCIGLCWVRRVRVLRAASHQDFSCDGLVLPCFALPLTCLDVIVLCFVFLFCCVCLFFCILLSLLAGLG